MTIEPELEGREPSSEKKNKRDAALDDLRSALTLLLVLYHAAQTFDLGLDHHVKAPERDRRIWLSHATLFVKTWHMPVFFLLAGWSLQASLHQR